MHKVGVIGLGDFGSFAIKALDLLDDFELYGVSELKSVPRNKNVKYFANYRELLRDPVIDVIFIATESFKHAQMAFEAIQAGKAVLCEKPLFISTQQKKLIEQATQKNQKPFKIDFVLPNNILYKKILDDVNKKALGEVIAIEIENFANEVAIKKKMVSRRSKNWRLVCHFRHSFFLFFTPDIRRKNQVA